MKKIDRRKFIKRSSAVGGLIVAGGMLGRSLANSIFAGNTDIAVITGNDACKNTMNAIELLGGIEKFVPAGSKVGLLVNSPWSQRGSFTNPTVALAVAYLCFENGATSVCCLKPAADEYWQRSLVYSKYADVVNKLSYNENHEMVTIGNGIYQHEFEIAAELAQCDVLINIPVAKHHRGAGFTGNLKNMMGLCTRDTNKKFHTPPQDFQGENTEYLSQSFIDLNKVRKPDLCIVDVSECMITNGPAGPGKVIAPNKIMAGTDPVALDTLAAETIGLPVEKILSLKYAAEQGIGNMDYRKMTIKEQNV